jgi:serine/threonine-protein kinase
VRRLGGRFVLERQIGTGGMSVIFLGRDEVLDRPVAVKVLKGGFESFEVGARFRREGRTAARLSHPNIVQVYDAGEDKLDEREVSYIVMEYVSGGDLKGLIDAEGPLAEKKLARIGADVASGLAHAHEKGIVHRDIKPQNILIDKYGHPQAGRLRHRPGFGRDDGDPNGFLPRYRVLLVARAVAGRGDHAEERHILFRLHPL